MEGPRVSHSNSDWTPSVRYINGLTIFFKKKDTVYVTDGKISVIFERWFGMAKGYYSSSWKPFTTQLKVLDGLASIYQVISIANKYGVECISATREETIPDGIKTHASRYNKAERRKKYGKK